MLKKGNQIFQMQKITGYMSSSNMNIMLIDDDEASHIIHKVVIEDAGACLDNVTSYYNVDEAIDALKKIIKVKSNDVWPDFIFLDINMPQKTGYDFLEEFEKINTDFDLPKIYFVSCSINPNDVKKAKELQLIHGFKSKFFKKEFIETLAMN